VTTEGGVLAAGGVVLELVVAPAAAADLGDPSSGVGERARGTVELVAPRERPARRGRRWRWSGRGRGCWRERRGGGGAGPGRGGGEALCVRVEPQPGAIRSAPAARIAGRSGNGRPGEGRAIEDPGQTSTPVAAGVPGPARPLPVQPEPERERRAVELALDVELG